MRRAVTGTAAKTRSHLVARWPYLSRVHDKAVGTRVRGGSLSGTGEDGICRYRAIHGSTQVLAEAVLTFPREPELHCRGIQHHSSSELKKKEAELMRWVILFCLFFLSSCHFSLRRAETVGLKFRKAKSIKMPDGGSYDGVCFPPMDEECRHHRSSAATRHLGSLCGSRSRRRVRAKPTPMRRPGAFDSAHLQPLLA